MLDARKVIAKCKFLRLDVPACVNCIHAMARTVSFRPAAELGTEQLRPANLEMAGRLAYQGSAWLSLTMVLRPTRSTSGRFSLAKLLLDFLLKMPSWRMLQ